MKIVRATDGVVRKIVHRMLQWPSKTIHLIYSIRVIKKNREKLRSALVRDHSQRLPLLTDEERPLGHRLAEDGFCVANYVMFESFRSTEFQFAAEEIYDCIEESYFKTGDNLDIIRLLRAYPSLLSQFKAVFRAGLDARLLKIVESYLKLPVAYGGVDIFFTIADGSERGARTWHKDSEDNPMVKVAVYLNDVDDSDGPLEILHLQHLSAASRNKSGFFHNQLIKLQEDGEIKFDITSFTGMKGTVILCDTFKYFHRGKPATGRNRRALFFNYYAQKPLTPYFCPNPPFSIDKMEDLVSDLSPEQRAAALWRENLTGIDKMVTKRRPYLNM
ncbi:hypothetical protein MMR14E_18390 [Methylobacterium mesophilicum]